MSILKTDDITFRVPFLPDDAPLADDPDAMRLPLYRHQRRSLYRILQIEANGRSDKSFGTFRFNNGKDYTSKGGCLCDAIGMGKTATILALICSEPRQKTLGANLLVAPSHLLAQWKSEVHKFVEDGEIDIIIGIDNFRSFTSTSNRTLVLCNVDDVVKSECYNYESGEIYRSRANQPLPPADKTRFREAARYISQGYKGPLWTSSLFFPTKPWRRVLFEEVQDLVEPGKVSQDCFIQLTRSAMNVWLVTATPFPRLSNSITANNQLLGFIRLKFDFGPGKLFQSDKKVFEEIKLRLYLRNPEPVRTAAITAHIPVSEVVVEYALSPLELLFYHSEVRSADVAAAAAKAATRARTLALETSPASGASLSAFPSSSSSSSSSSSASSSFLALSASAAEVIETDTLTIRSAISAAGPAAGSASVFWDAAYDSARRAATHPALSARLQEVAKEMGFSLAGLRRVQVSYLFGRFKGYIRSRLVEARSDLSKAILVEEATRNSLSFVRVGLENGTLSWKEIFRNQKYYGISSLFSADGISTFRGIGRHLFEDEQPQKKKKKKGNPPTEHFRPAEEHILYSSVEILDYLERWCAKREEQEHFHTQMRVNLSAASLTLAERQAAVGALEADCAATERYAQAMKLERNALVASTEGSLRGTALCAPLDDYSRWTDLYGSKIAQLIQYLRQRLQQPGPATATHLSTHIAAAAAALGLSSTLESAEVAAGTESQATLAAAAAAAAAPPEDATARPEKAAAGPAPTEPTPTPSLLPRPKIIVFTMWDHLLLMAARALTTSNIKNVIFPQEQKQANFVSAEAGSQQQQQQRQQQPQHHPAQAVAPALRSSSRGGGRGAGEEDEGFEFGGAGADGEDDEGDEGVAMDPAASLPRQQQLAEANGVAEMEEADAASMSRAKALEMFVSGEADVLMLSSLNSASGINLQVACEVVFLDCPGLSPAQGATLEQQAIGRILRLGQDKPIRVVRFIGKETCDSELFADVARASKEASSALQRLDGEGQTADGSGRGSYVCRGYAAPLPHGSSMSVLCASANARAAEEAALADQEKVEVEKEMSLADSLALRSVQAAADGRLIEILDSDEEQEEEEGEDNMDEEDGAVGAVEAANISAFDMSKESQRRFHPYIIDVDDDADDSPAAGTGKASGPPVGESVVDKPLSAVGSLLYRQVSTDSSEVGMSEQPHQSLLHSTSTTPEQLSPASPPVEEACCSAASPSSAVTVAVGASTAGSAAGVGSAGRTAVAANVLFPLSGEIKPEPTAVCANSRSVSSGKRPLIPSGATQATTSASANKKPKKQQQGKKKKKQQVQQQQQLVPSKSWGPGTYAPNTQLQQLVTVKPEPLPQPACD